MRTPTSRARCCAGARSARPQPRRLPARFREPRRDPEDQGIGKPKEREAFQFDWSEDWAIIGGERTKLQVAHAKLSCADVADMARPHDLELGNLPWEDAEVQAAIAWCLGRKLTGVARAIGQGRWAGFRRGTICRVPLGARRRAVNARGEAEQRLNWIAEKRKVLCDKREDSRLTALIESTPNRALAIAYNQDGNPWKERQLNQALDRMIADLAKKGLARPQLTLHGLRHARGEELAAVGASDAEIMAQPEQSTEHSARIYRRCAARRRLADGAQDRIDSNVIPLPTAPAQATGTARERPTVKACKNAVKRRLQKPLSAGAPGEIRTPDPQIRSLNRALFHGCAWRRIVPHNYMNMLAFIALACNMAQH